MPAETDDEVLEVELHMEALLNEVNVHMAAAYQAGMWCDLCWGGGQGTMGSSPSWRVQKQHVGADMSGWAWCVLCAFAEVEQSHVWSWRLCASAACCV